MNKPSPSNGERFTSGPTTNMKPGDIFEFTTESGKVVTARVREFDAAKGICVLDPISEREGEPGWIPAFIVEPKDKKEGDYWMVWTLTEIEKLRGQLTEQAPLPVMANYNHGQPLVRFCNGVTMTVADLNKHGAGAIGTLLKA